MLLSYLVRMIHYRPHCKTSNKQEKVHLSPIHSPGKPLGVLLIPSYVFGLKLSLCQTSICLVTPSSPALIMQRERGLLLAVCSILSYHWRTALCLYFSTSCLKRHGKVAASLCPDGLLPPSDAGDLRCLFPLRFCVFSGPDMLRPAKTCEFGLALHVLSRPRLWGP